MTPEPRNEATPADQTAGATQEVVLKPDPIAAETIQEKAPARIGLVGDLTDIPAVAEYADRIGAASRSLRKLVVVERADQYARTLAAITFADDGSITAPADFAPTDQEAAAIKAAWGLVKWAEQQPFLYTGKDDPRPDASRPWSLADPANIAICWDRERKTILCVEERRPRADGGKDVWVWTFWNDGQWRIAEPPKLPLYGLETIRHATTIMVHEGPKAAKAVQALIADDSDRGWRNHPWGRHLRGAVLGNVAHVAWMGGAERPGDTDFSPLASSGAEIILVCDNDRAGKDTSRPISRAVSARAKALFFTDDWPKSFDLADEFPPSMFKRRGDGRAYVGPRFKDCLRAATWATDVVQDGRGRPSYFIRREFVSEWMVSSTPALYFHRDDPSTGFREEEFNVRVRGFSDAEDTARLLRHHPSVLADGITYAPGRTQGVIGDEDGRQLINTWKPTPIQKASGSAKPWLQFVTYLLPIKQDRFHFLRWYATLIARPDIRIQWGVIMRSETQGTGKTTAGSILAALVGHDNVSMPGEDTLAEGKFNSFLARKRLVICNEFYSGQSFRTYNRMKTWITDTKVEVEMKYMAAHTVPAYAHFFLCSNDLVPILIGGKDRRFFIPTVTERKRSREYWSKFNAWLSIDGLGIIRRWAEEFVDKHGPCLPGEEAPATVAKEAMIDRAMTDEMRFVRDLADEIAGRAKIDPPQRVLFPLDEFRTWLARQEFEGKRMKGNLVDAYFRQAGLIVRSNNSKTGKDERVKIDGRNRIVVMNFEPEEGEKWPDLVERCRVHIDDLAPL